MTKRRWTDEQLIQAIPKSITIADVLRELGMDPRGRNYRSIKRRVAALNLDISHFLGQAHKKGKPSKHVGTRPIKSLLVVGSDIMSSGLKERLLNEKLLEYKCKECGINDWNNRPLSLQLDHINGISDDNRLENLRLLCPNCHSQTPTFGGRNLKRNSGNGRS